MLAVYFLACCLRKTPPISSRFRFARTCVPSCVTRCDAMMTQYHTRITTLSCCNIYVLHHLYSSTFVHRIRTKKHTVLKSTYLAFCDLECTLVLANLEQFHNALLIWCQTCYLAHNLTHKLDTLGGMLWVGGRCGVGMVQGVSMQCPQCIARDAAANNDIQLGIQVVCVVETMHCATGSHCSGQPSPSLFGATAARCMQ